MDTGYRVETIEEKTIAEYLQTSLFEVDELDLVEYLFYLREAFIYNCSQSEDGREYLKNAFRLEQTTPERAKLREQFGTHN